MKIAILGAGLTGIELGRRLKEINKNFIILEKESKIGGLCRTNKTGEYYWDLAVHAMYSRHPEIMDYFNSLPLDYESLKRNVKIFHTGSNGRKNIIDYPFEIGVKDLPINDKLECVQGYIAVKVKDKKHVANLKEWIDNHLGEGIAKHFMVPYNNKIWNCDLSEISTDLVTSKIEPPSAIDFILSVVGKKTIGRKYQSVFIYPKQGIQKLIDYTAKDIKDNIVLNAAVNKLVRHGKRWVVIDDKARKIDADMVISTIPLVELLKKIDMDGLQKGYDVFRWNNTYFVMVGLKKGYAFNFINDCHWVLFKENEIFYRITLMHNFSSEFMTVLVAEITQKGDVMNCTEEEIKDLVLDDLIRMGIVGSLNQIAVTDLRLIAYTYPIPTVGLEDTKNYIRCTLEKHNLFLLGRNGNWDYVNIDGVIMNVQKFVSEQFIPVPYLDKIITRAEKKSDVVRATEEEPKETATIKGRILFASKFLISIVLLMFLFGKLDLSISFVALKQAHIGFLSLAFLFGSLFIMVKAFKWFNLVREYISEPNFWMVWVSYIFGLGVSIVTPGRIGEIARIVNIGIKEKTGPMGLFLLDKLIDVLVVSSMALFGIHVIFPNRFNITIFTVFLLAGMTAIFFMKRFYKIIRCIFEKIPFGSTLDKLFRTLAELKPQKIAVNLMLTLVSYTICIFQAYFIIKAFTHINLAEVFNVHPIVMLTNIVPVTVSGLGLREGASIFLYSKLGILKEHAFWGGFLIFALTTFLYGMLGIILMNFKIRRKK